MNNDTIEQALVPNWAQFPSFDLRQLPAQLSKRLWVSPTEFLILTHALLLADWALGVARRWRPCLPELPRRGPKAIYQDRSILVMALLQVAWQMSYEEIVDYLRARPEARVAAGFDPGRVISVGQYWERRRRLGVLPFWLFFVGMVWQLLCMGVIVGKDVILDATTQAVWFRADPEAAWSFPKPGKGSTWGYKVHTLMCRWSDLPIMFLVTSANRQESLLAIPLLVLAAVCFGLTFTIVRADAGYFTYPILNFIRTVLHASFMIDYNLRRQGKRFLATRFFCSQWRFHLRPRAAIERLFARAKRYFGLERAQWLGLTAAYQHTALVYATMLAVALIAHRFQRPELALSRSRVLALKTLA
jgi:hypothetical protein